MYSSRKNCELVSGGLGLFQHFPRIHAGTCVVWEAKTTKLLSAGHVCVPICQLHPIPHIVNVPRHKPTDTSTLISIVKPGVWSSANLFQHPCFSCTCNGPLYLTCFPLRVHYRCRDVRNMCLWSWLREGSDFEHPASFVSVSGLYSGDLQLHLCRQLPHLRLNLGHGRVVLGPCEPLSPAPRRSR